MASSPPVWYDQRMQTPMLCGSLVSCGQSGKLDNSRGSQSCPNACVQIARGMFNTGAGQATTQLVAAHSPRPSHNTCGSRRCCSCFCCCLAMPSKVTALRCLLLPHCRLHLLHAAWALQSPQNPYCCWLLLQLPHQASIALAVHLRLLSHTAAAALWGLRSSPLTARCP